MGRRTRHSGGTGLLAFIFDVRRNTGSLPSWAFGLNLGTGGTRVHFLYSREAHSTTSVQFSSQPANEPYWCIVAHTM